ARLAARRTRAGRRDRRGVVGAAGRGPGTAPGRPADRNRRANQGHRRPHRADRDARPGRDQPARAGIRRDDGPAGRIGGGAAAGAQRRLVADASHELRTPLTSLITNLELLAEQPDDPSAPTLVAAALAEAGELRMLVNDLVELARDGRASFHIEDVRLDLVAE